MATRSSGNLSPNIRSYTCAPGERKSFPDGVNGLYLFVDHRSATATEPRRVFMFDARLRGRTQQQRIGEYPTWTLEKARRKARELRTLIDEGTAPVEIVERKRAEDERRAAQRAAERVVLLDAWQAYIEDRQASAKPLGERSVRDMNRHIGDRPERVGNRGAERKAGPLEDWQTMPLAQITADVVRARHALLVRQRGAAQANQSMRLLRAVLNFAGRDARFKGAMGQGNPVSVLTERKQWADVEPRARALERGQLKEWWAATQRLDNATVRDYMRFLLFTGARRSEALGLLWADVDFRWHSITFRDTKTGGDRVVPMTRFVEVLLVGLRDRAAAAQRVARERAVRRGEQYTPGPREGFVFGIVEPAKGVQRVAQATGVHLSSHDMRRSFASLSEWCEIPEGIVRQVMGHSARGDVHQHHYRVRPLDLLAMHVQRFEDWILTEAGQQPVPAPEQQQGRAQGTHLFVAGGSDAAQG